MAIYMALLRGINVSGKNMIKMTELKRILEEMGLGRVQTYINSGNVLFESAEPEATLCEQIAQQIHAEFGLSIPVMLRSAEEIEQMIAARPYKAELDPKGKNVNVGMMPEPPSEEGIARLANYKFEDDFQIIGRDIHLLFRQSTADSKLANNLQKLGIPATVRNWNTIMKLDELARAMSV